MAGPSRTEPGGHKGHATGGIGKVFGGGNNVQREAFDGTSEALNALQVKFDCGEGNERGKLSECVRLTTAYLSFVLKYAVLSLMRSDNHLPSLPSPQ